MRCGWAICGGWTRSGKAHRAGVPILNNMNKRTMLYVGGLVLALGGPISMFSAGDFLAGAKKSWFSGVKAQAAAPKGYASDVSADGSATSASAPLAIGPNSSRVENTPLPSLPEVLNLDVTVEWVLQRWPRVTTGLTQLQLQGYRVPLVSGTSTADVAGSLTYYFNSRQQAQRITLRGATGDPSVLANILISRFHFTRRFTNDPGVVVFEAVDSSNQPAGSLNIRSAPVVKADQPYARFQVDLVLDRVE
jgi:hypothetical protein